jgi:hypothetical protein
LWLALLALGLLALFRAEHVALDSREPLPWFWPASFAWALVAVVNPLVWPYWQLLAVPLFLIYFARGTARSWRGDRPRFWFVVAGFTAMNWLQNYPVVHYGGGLVALLALMIDAYRQARGNALGSADDELRAPLSASSNV